MSNIRASGLSGDPLESACSLSRAIRPINLDESASSKIELFCATLQSSRPRKLEDGFGFSIQTDFHRSLAQTKWGCHSRNLTGSLPVFPRLFSSPACARDIHGGPRTNSTKVPPRLFQDRMPDRIRCLWPIRKNNALLATSKVRSLCHPPLESFFYAPYHLSSGINSYWARERFLGWSPSFPESKPKMRLTVLVTH